MGQRLNTFQQTGVLQKVGDSLYLGKPPEIIEVPNPVTGVIEYTKVSGVPFVRVTPTGNKDEVALYRDDRRPRFRKPPEVTRQAYFAEV